MAIFGVGETIDDTVPIAPGAYLCFAFLDASIHGNHPDDSALRTCAYHKPPNGPLSRNVGAYFRVLDFRLVGEKQTQGPAEA
jgi:hypothetical protein